MAGDGVDEIVDASGPADDGGRAEDLAVGASCGRMLNVGC
jgi:hypothetical protein